MKNHELIKATFEEKKYGKKLNDFICCVNDDNVIFMHGRENDQNFENPNRMIEISSDGNKGMQYLFSFQVGHLSSDCKNSCIMIGGVTMHKNCMGYGHVCNRTASVFLQQIGTSIVAMTTDTFGLTSEDFFNMPARSLSTPTIGPEHYLNIPAQVVYRDSAKQQFTFTGLFYSETPAYNNF